MADKEIEELKDYLKTEFASIRDEFASIRGEIAAAKEETMRHTGVLIEGIEHKLDLLVEGREATHERMAMDREENEREHGRLEKITLMHTADISKLDHRVGRLEGKP